MTQRPFKFPLEEQKELFPDMKHDSTYMYDDDTLIAGTDNYWNKDSELTLKWDDPSININWPLSTLKQELNISEKDRNGLSLDQLKNIHQEFDL